MKKITKHIFTGLSCLFIIVSCSSSDGDSGTEPTGGSNEDGNDNATQAPTEATLVFPEKNEACNEGIVKSDDENAVTFHWNASLYTDTYTVTLSNLNSGNSFETVSNTNETTITLQRGALYEWFVVSSANGNTKTVESETWRFYNEGPGIENYAPFPAEAVEPIEGADLNTETVALIWQAIDIDDDIAEYEVFFGLENKTLESLGLQIENKITVALKSNSRYEWQVKVIDTSGNSTYSPIFKFQTL